MPDYLVYGLHIRADRAIPGFPEVGSADGAVDVTVTFDRQVVGRRFASVRWSPHPTLIYDAPGEDPGAPEVAVEQSDDGRFASLRFADNAQFAVAADGSEVYALTPEDMTQESVCVYVENSVLALCLRLRGSTGLHASAVAIDGVAVVFAAPGGSGKSTIAFELGRLGHSVMTDDLAVLGGDPLVVYPGYPRVRLWPWTVDGLLGDPEALPKICDDWDKRRADVTDFDLRPKPVAALFLLDGFSDSVEIERVPAPRACVSLMENASLSRLLDHEMRQRDFEFFGSVVSRVPVLHLRRPKSLTSVGESGRAVVDWLRANLPS